MSLTNPASFEQQYPPSDRGVMSLCAHEVFERVACGSPGRTAVVCGDERLTYGRLNAWSNGIAAALIEAGVGQEEPIGLAVPKSGAQVAAVFGILKAGGAYVPLVANQPAERLRSIVKDAACRFAVAGPGRLDDVFGAGVVRIDPEGFRSSEAPNPGLPMSPDRLAYIMYTSGSTGLPKGAMIEHSGIVRLVHGQTYMPFGPELHFLYGGPLSFDLSTIEIFTPLLHGATLLISPEDILTPERIDHFARHEGLAAVCISFSLFRALFEADAAVFERVPVIGVCGEPADPRFLRHAQRRLPDARFYNAYGPTECTALTTTHQIPRPCPLDPPVVPIGIPLNAMCVRVVGPDLREVAAGEAGELLIGGLGVGRGYLNDPALTAARFIPDPSAPRSGARMYRSGDRVREIGDGVIAYLGRMDDQVKIRGQRIELGEVEAALTADPDVLAAACAVVGRAENARIGACVVPSNPKAFDEGAVMQRVAGRVTRAMTPSLIRVVGSIPVTRNGKADRARVVEILESDGVSQSLDEPAASTPAGRAPTESEQAVARLVAEVLGVPDTPVDRSFVGIGGNSLGAMILRARLRDRFGADLAAVEILEAPDIRSLARLVDGRSGASPRALGSDHGATSVGPEGVIPMSPAQRRLWTLHQLDPADAAYNIAYRLRFSGIPDRAALEAAWADLHARHSALRTVFSHPRDAEPGASILAGVTTAVQWLGDNESPGWIAREIVRPFSLDQPPLARLIVAGDGPSPTGVLVMHHIVSDAWSMEVMLRDLAEFYLARLTGRAPSLPDPGPGMGAYAAGRLAMAQDPATADLARAAALELGGGTRALLFPDADADPGVGVHATTVRLSAAMAGDIEAVARFEGVTAHAVLLAAYAGWVSALTDTPEPVIGLALSTRDDGPFENAVGFFVETAPVVVPVGTGSLGELARRAADATHGARRRRSVPFDLLAELVDAPFAPGRTPITDIFFNTIDRAPVACSPEASRVLTPEFREIDNGLARFEMLCTVYRDGAGSEVSLVVRRPKDRDPTSLPAASGFVDFLESAVRDPLAPIAALKDRTTDQAASGPGDAPVTARPKPGSSSGHILLTVIDVFRTVLGHDDMGPHDDFFVRGGNSLKAVRAFAMIRDRLGTHLPTGTIFRASTPAGLAVLIEKDPETVHAPALLRMSDTPGTRALYLAPGIGGNLVSFAPLVRNLNGEFSCIGLEFPGQGGSGRPLESVNALARYFIEQVQPSPVVATDLAGYSFGGLIAFEMAMRLQEAGHAPGLLVLLDAYQPVSPRWSLRKRLWIHIRIFWGLNRAERAVELRQRLSRLVARLIPARPEKADEDAFDDQRSPIHRTNRASLRSYVPHGRYRGPVLIIRGRRFRWAQFYIDDGANGWRRHLDGPVHVVDIDAEHSKLLRAENAPELAAHIRRWVCQVPGRATADSSDASVSRAAVSTPTDRSNSASASRSTGV